MKISARIIWAVFVGIFCGVCAFAQSTTATLSGRISDASGGVLPGVQVTVTNSATGIKRALTTDAGGKFIAAQLPPGPYEVSATMNGFETLVNKGVVLTVGQEANLELAMKVGAVSEQVTVTEDAPLVNTTSSAVAGVVEEKRIQELPLNGRDFSQLPLIQPGVASVRNGDVTVTKGYGARISMGGSRPDQTAWLLDGTNIHSPSNFGTPGSAAGVMLGVEAVREFQVLTSNYSAELGGTSGGVVNMVSKSGTNDYHGTLYEFLRNSKLDARRFFDRSKPDFKRNQFGASFGGHIKKDQTFFFSNFEGLRQRQGVTSPVVVPDDNAHLGLIPDGAGGLRSVGVAPSVKPYLDLWPRSPLNKLDAKGNTTGLADLFAIANSPVNENFFVARVDHHINDKQTIFSRFTFDQGVLTSPDAVPITTSQVQAHTRYVTVQHDYIASSQLLMTTRVAYNRTLLKSDEIALISYPASLELFFPGFLPSFSFTGATGFGPGTQNLVRRAQNLYDFQENLQYIRGNHSFKFGFLLDQIGFNKSGETGGLNGGYTWNTLSDFLTDARLSAFSGAAIGSDTSRSYKQYIYGTYLQDDWKMSPRFTWNLGVRYEPFSTPTEKYGRISMLKDWVHDAAFSTDIGLFKNPSKNKFSPRVGFAWDPKGNGKTAIRAGFGIFYVDILNPYYATPGQKNPPFFAATASVLGNLATSVADMTKIAPALLNPTLTPNTFMELIQWDLRSSYEMKANFTVVQQLPWNMSVSIGYLGNRGIHLWRNSDANDAPFAIVNGRRFVATGAQRLNRNAGVGTTRYSDAQSFYNGMQFEVKKNVSRGLQFQVSYTFSKNIDDATTGVANTDFNEGVSTQGYDPKADRGLSALSQKQVFVVNGVYQIPSPNTSPIASHILGGWQLSSIFTASAGTPFSPRVSGRNAQDLSRSTGGQRPDLVEGRNSGNMTSGTTAGCGTTVKAGTKLGTPDLYFDPCGFVLPPAGVFGNAGRNILIGPGFLNFDFSLTKSTPIGLGEGHRLEFRAEFFNVFNHANFGLPSATGLQVINPTNGQYIAGGGKLDKVVNTARQMQFGLKMYF